jgi:hypothetical protein
VTGICFDRLYILPHWIATLASLLMAGVSSAATDPAPPTTEAQPNQNQVQPATQQPVNPGDTVKATLDAKVKLAEATIAGKDPLYADVSLDRLMSYHSVIFRCDGGTPGNRNDRRYGCENEDDLKQKLCVHAWYETADCSASVFEEIDRRNDLLIALHEEAKAIKADANQTETLASYRKRQAPLAKKALSREVLRGGGYYGFYAGPSFLLQEGGDWKTGTEFYANFVTEAFDRDHCPWAPVCRAYFDASFVTTDAFPKEADDDSTAPVAVFDSKGRLRIRGAYQWHWNDWLGAETGIGITSLDSDRSTSTRTEPRAHVGAHFETAFPDLAVGEVFFGYARDKSWERLVDTDGDLATTTDQRVERRFDRLILDGTLVFPRVELGGFSLGVKLSADLPWSGDTQSEIRGSILIYYSLNAELEKYRPKVKEKSE